MPRSPVKRVLIGAGLAAGGVLGARVLGPKLRERGIRGCAEMFDRMPDEMPPKRIMRGIEDIREQNARILRLLEERDAGPSGASG